MKIVIRGYHPGDGTITPSLGTASVVEASTASTVVSVTASATRVPVGSPTTLTAGLTGSLIPTGNVTFLVDGNPIASCGRIVG